MRKLLDRIVEATGYRPRVLVVDDDPTTVAILQFILESRIDICVATNRAAALEQCHAVHPDLILLDVNVGKEDGFELCQTIRQHPALDGIPIIFITGSPTEEDEVRAFTLGAVDFVRKPISAFIAESRVVTHLALQLQMALLKRVAHSDGLTGLKNRSSFDQELERNWKECARTAWPLSIIMIDIDFFKKFNDNYGHLAGDDCLRRVAAAIQGALCRPGDCAARYGGEEFACILPSTDFNGALGVAQNMRARISALGIAHRDGATAAQLVTASVGVATCYPLATDGWVGLMAAADQQLYRAKGMGRDRVCGNLCGAGSGRSGHLATPAGSPLTALWPSSTFPSSKEA